jgi:hypothetical protein
MPACVRSTTATWVHVETRKLALAIREGEHLLAGLFAEIFWNALQIDLL